MKKGHPQKLEKKSFIAAKTHKTFQNRNADLCLWDLVEKKLIVEFPAMNKSYCSQVSRKEDTHPSCALVQA